MHISLGTELPKGKKASTEKTPRVHYYFKEVLHHGGFSGNRNRGKNLLYFDAGNSSFYVVEGEEKKAAVIDTGITAGTKILPVIRELTDKPPFCWSSRMRIRITCITWMSLMRCTCATMKKRRWIQRRSDADSGKIKTVGGDS